MAPKGKLRSRGKWFILYCAEDESHCMVRASDVICEESATVGDTVQFFFNRKTPYEGVIKDLGEDENKMDAALEAFNAKKVKREASFHEGSPRKSKKQGKSLIRSWTVATKNTSTSEPKVPSKVPTTNKKQEYSQKKIRTERVSAESGKCSSRAISCEPSSDSEVEQSAVDIDMNNSDSDSDISPELLAKIEKIAKKRKLSALNELLNLNRDRGQQHDPYCKPLIIQNKSSSRQDGSSSTKGESTPNQASNIPKSVEVGDGVFHDVTPIVNVNSSGPEAQGALCTQNDQVGPSSRKDQGEPSISVVPEASASDDEGSIKSSNKPTAIVRRRYRPAYSKAVFTGNYFKHSKDDLEVVQLNEKFEVYVSKEGLSTIKRNGKSGTDTARMLLMEVFSAKAVEECSVTGRPAAGRGKDQATLRPPLDANGVAAIHAFATARAKKKGWKVPELKDTNKALADKLGETRYYKRLEEQAKNVATA